MLCQPMSRKATEDHEGYTTFAWKPRWFTLSQTEGEPIEPMPTPGMEKARNTAALQITEAAFTDTNGNVQGYAKGREIAISPIAEIPHKTLFHELAHVELGHTAEADFNDGEHTPRNLREVEAEAVAMLLCESLEVPGAEYSRGYIQNWLKDDVIPEKSAQKIFGAADRILKSRPRARARDSQLTIGRIENCARCWLTYSFAAPRCLDPAYQFTTAKKQDPKRQRSPYESGAGEDTRAGFNPLSLPGVRACFRFATINPSPPEDFIL